MNIFKIKSIMWKKAAAEIVQEELPRPFLRIKSPAQRKKEIQYKHRRRKQKRGF